MPKSTQSTPTHNGEATLPPGWRWYRLGDLVERLDYGFTASADLAIKEPRFLRITDIQDSKVEWDKVPGCTIADDDIASNRLVDGDIVFARTGATTGKSFLVREPPLAVFASYLIGLRVKPAVEPDFLWFFFQSDHYWKQIRENARGGIQPNFNATMLAALPVIVPPPRATPHRGPPPPAACRCDQSQCRGAGPDRDAGHADPRRHPRVP